MKYGSARTEHLFPLSRQPSKQHIMKASHLFLVSLILPLSSCGFIAPQQILPTLLSMYTPKKINKVGMYYTEASLIEGKTQKTYVVETLGLPDSSLTNRSYSFVKYNYSSRPVHIKAKIRVVRRDGSDMELVVGNGERYSSVTIYFDGRNIIKTIQIE